MLEESPYRVLSPGVSGRVISRPFKAGVAACVLSVAARSPIANRQPGGLSVKWFNFIRVSVNARAFNGSEFTGFYQAPTRRRLAGP